MQSVPVTVDSRGRVRASKEQRRLILAEFERSGVSATRFAKRTGLKYSTLAGWLQRYRRTKPPGRAQPMRLLEAVVELLRIFLASYFWPIWRRKVFGRLTTLAS
jgi:transposase